MADSTERREVADAIGTIARHWVWILWFGIITIVAGLFLAILPHLSLLAVALLFGVYLVIAAIYRFVSAFSAPNEAAWVRVLFALIAVISLIVGLFLLRHLFFGLLLLGVLLGMFWIISGFIDIFIAIGYRHLPGRWWTLFTGLLSLIAGILVLADPVLSLHVLAYILGIFLILAGIVIVIQSLAVRRLGKRARAAAAPTA